MKTSAFVMGLMSLMAVGCGEITAADMAAAGGAGGTVDAQGMGGHAAGVGGMTSVPGTGGAPIAAGTGGAAAAYPFCEPTEALTVDTAICQKLNPGGTYSNRTKDGYVCGDCQPTPPATMGVKNLPCLYNNKLCTHDCTTECN
jgi:hypothetical protein